MTLPVRLRWRERVALAAYAAGLRLLLPLILLRYWWRGAREPGYRLAMRERLGFIVPQPPGALWLHAVSLGETRAAGALVEALRLQWPGMRLLLTCGTATGRDAGRLLLRDADTQTWLPLDTPGAVRRFLERARPVAGVLMETEIWPRLLHEAQRAAVPVVLANARLSERSARRGAALSALMRPAAATLARVLAQSEGDATRLCAAGGHDLRVCGNLKFDIHPAPALLARGRAWRAALGRPVVLAAITRDGEEAALLRAWQRVAGQRPLLLVVPRHPQRFDEVATLLRGSGLRLARRSTWSESPPAEALAADAWLGDSLGEMPQYYACADIALLGGSFGPFGGHNLIEAAASGCPIVLGPSTFNFAEAAHQAVQAGAAWRVADIAEAVDLSLRRIGTPELEAATARAVAFAGSHRGAAERMAAEIIDVALGAGR